MGSLDQMSALNADNPSRPSWYGLNFPSRLIQGLPRRISLGQTGQFEVGYARSEDEDPCKKLIQCCRERGQNVDVSQFIDEDDFLYFFFMSEVFTLYKVKDVSSLDPTTDIEAKLEVLIVVQPSPLARTLDRCLAQLYIFISDDSLSRNDHVNDDLIALTLTLTADLDLGYTRCIVTVASSLPDVVAAYRRAGFIVMATIPEGVQVKGLGISDDFYLSKSLGLPDRQRRSWTEIEALCGRIVLEASDILQQLRKEGILPVPFLPKPYIFQSGLKVIVRSLRLDEIPAAYEIWKQAAEKGQGYGLDECPSLESFELIIIADHYCIVFEDEVTKNFVGLTFITDSWYARNKERKYGESNLFINEKYRGRGLGVEGIYLELIIMKQLGYSGSLNDALLSNSVMIKTLKHGPLPFVTLGAITDGTYTAGKGWDDQIITYVDFRDRESILENFVDVADRRLAEKLEDKTKSKLQKHEMDPDQFAFSQNAVPTSC